VRRKSPVKVGLTALPILEPLFRRRGLVDIAEIEPQMYWGETDTGLHPVRGALEWLGSLEQERTLHGVSNPVGGSTDPDDASVSLWRSWANQLDPTIVSEHLAFNRTPGPSGIETGFFLPLLQTKPGIAAAATEVRRVSGTWERPFAIENGVNYLRSQPGEVTDGEFFGEIVSRSSSFVVLDLHNALVNQRNGRQPVREFVNHLPLDRVIEVHLADGFYVENTYLDAHSGVPSRELWELARQLLPSLPNLQVVVLEILPSFVEGIGLSPIVRALQKLRALLDDRRPRPIRATDARATAPTPSAAITSPREWEQTLGELAAGFTVTTELGKQLAGDPGLPLLRTLVRQGRSGALAAAVPRTLRHLQLTHGSQLLGRILGEYFETHAPRLFGLREAEQFGRFLESSRFETPALRDVREPELADARAALGR
jgi:uncharacterized protein